MSSAALFAINPVDLRSGRATHARLSYRRETDEDSNTSNTFSQPLSGYSQ